MGQPWRGERSGGAASGAEPIRFPVLRRTTDKAGNGKGSALDEIIAERSDLFHLLFHELVHEWRVPARAG